MARRIAVVLALVALAAGAGGCGDEGAQGAAPAGALAESQRRLAGAPAPLAALHRQGAELLGGGLPAFRARMRELRGYPVVVNVWGSWCGPCRAEFPVFRRVATARGRTVAFLGVDTIDNDQNARRFLAEHPVPYPSYRDPDGVIAQELKAVSALPATVFFDRSGRPFVKQGGYRSDAELLRDIDRYAR